jgi:protein-L-isoaspartate(D-aspartate) O-methyltransferase
MGFKELRDLMVKGQLVPRGIRDKGVLRAMRKVPRHLFVGEAMLNRAYDDMALQIGEGQTISQPYMVAVMTEVLELEGSEKVLEIGTGSGYQTAILAELSGEVFTIERHESLSEQASARLSAQGYANVHFMTGDGTCGWPSEAPFQRVLITAAAPEIPATLKEQLSLGGIIVAPVGSRYSQTLTKARKLKEGFSEELHTPCVFVPLVGKHGWESE